MKRMLGAAIVAAFAAAAAQAHFPFIVAEPDGKAAKVIFSDDLSPDAKVDIEKLANTKLTVRDVGGKDSPLEWKKGDGFYRVDLPGSGPRVIFGTTEYGVLQKGDVKPFRLTYFPKALVGMGSEKAPAVGAALKVEILPISEAGKIRFRVVHVTKPVPGAEVTVLLPDGTKKALKTDENGLTPPFDQSGRFGVFARVTVIGAGEHAGKKYEETRYYATLVMDVPVSK